MNCSGQRPSLAGAGNSGRATAVSRSPMNRKHHERQKQHATIHGAKPTADHHEACPNDLSGEVTDDVVIFRYSRAEAIQDGVLIDATELAREAGFRYPVALTSAAWHECVSVPPTDAVHDEAGRLWDVLSVLRFTICASRDMTEIPFCVEVCAEREMTRRVKLKAVCGPGDDAEPVITVMLPDED